MRMVPYRDCYLSVRSEKPRQHWSVNLFFELLTAVLYKSKKRFTRCHAQSARSHDAEARLYPRCELRSLPRRDKGFDLSIVDHLKLKVLPVCLQGVDDATLGISGAV